MAINFPASPTLNQTFSSGNVNYVWDGTKWTASVTGGISLDKIEEGNTSAEVIDTGSDGRFVVTTEGGERLRVDSSGRVGIGTTAPSHLLDLLGSAPRVRVKDSSTGATFGHFENNSGNFYIGTDNSTGGSLSAGNYARVIWSQGAYPLVFATNDTQRAQIDSSGRLLVGTSTSIGQGGLLQVVGGDAARPQIHRNVNDQYDAVITLSKARGTGTEAVSNNDDIGSIFFQGANGSAFNTAARIQCSVDGTVSGGGANDMPGRLVFSTTADGASSPTERMRITANGSVLINTTTEGAGIGFNPKLAVETSSTDTAVIKNSAGASANCLYTWNAGTSGNNAFIGFGTEGTYTQRGSINYNRGSGVVAYNTTSDYRAKSILGPLVNTGSTIDALQVYNGVMNGATVERPMLVAHEAQEVAPYCVTGEKDAVDDDGNPIYQQMDHQVLVPLLIAEIQSLRQRVAALEGV